MTVVRGESPPDKSDPANRNDKSGPAWLTYASSTQALGGRLGGGVGAGRIMGPWDDIMFPNLGFPCPRSSNPTVCTSFNTALLS